MHPSSKRILLIKYFTVIVVFVAIAFFILYKLIVPSSPGDALLPLAILSVLFIVIVAVVLHFAVNESIAIDEALISDLENKTDALVNDQKQVKDLTDKLQQLLSQTHRLETENALLTELTLSISTAPDLTSALFQVIRKICDVTSWSAGDAWVRDDASDRLYFACNYANCETPEINDFVSATRGFTFLKGEGLPGKCWETGSTVWLDDVLSAKFFTRNQLAARAGMKSAIGVPVIVEKKLLAVMCFYMLKKEKKEEQPLEMIETLAGQLALLIRQKQGESSLVTSEQKFRNIIEATPEAVVLANSKGIIIDVNRGAERMFGYEEGGLNNKPLTILMPEKYREAHAKGMKRFTATGEAHVLGKVVELEGLTSDGRVFPLELSLAFWTESGEIYYSGIMRDITERKERENEIAGLIASLKEGYAKLEQELQEKRELQVELENLNDELERRVAARTVELEKRTRELEYSNQELSNISFIVSHDLKAPLRAIGSLSDFLVEDFADKLGEEGKQNVLLIKQRVTRLTNLINSLLEYSRAGRLLIKKEDVDLRNAISTVLTHIDIPEDFTINVPDLPVIQSDPVILPQIFQNLIDNAIKYMDKPHGIIDIICDVKDNEVILGVRDNGPGIPEEYHQKIFDLFQTLKSRDEIESSGVGLTIVKKLVQRLGGKMWVESEDGKGATFYFSLPK